MIKLFDTTLPCGVALLEYSEGKDIRDFDLSVPLNLGIISDVVGQRNPDLVETCKEVLSKDPVSGLMFDSFLSKKDSPAFVSFANPEVLLGIYDVEFTKVEDKDYYASVIYLGRDKEVRIVYRDPYEPELKTNIHDKDGNYLYSETLYKGELPAELAWANEIQDGLVKSGLKARVNHYKLNEDYPSKVYFKILP